MKRQTLLSLLLTSAVVAAAYTITGRVADPQGEPLISASVRLLSARDSSAVNGVVTDVDGNFKFENLNGRRYIVETSYVGYEPIYNNVDLRQGNASLGTITLRESATMLHEMEVVGIRTPITVKEDTIEYDASAYRTAPNAVVEDLVRRLPGAEVSSDGKITVNGQEISKILIDGKEFFSDDPTVASRNIPADMVDRLQVVNRKSDLARLTGVDDGEDETVINLTVKKNMQNGWFGTIQGGYGTDDRYNGSFNINRFWNGNQITFIGALNNVNDLSFTDGTSSRFRRFGGQNGITTSQAFGINFNVGNGEKFRIGGDVMYSRSDRDARQSTSRQYLFADSTSYYNSGKRSRDIGNNLRADFRLQWKPDSLNTIDFRPYFSYNHSNGWSVDSAMTYAGDAARSLVSASRNRSSSHGDSWEFGGRLIANHKFASRPGRALSLYVNYKFSDVQEYGDAYSWNRFFRMDSLDVYDQYSDNHTWSNNISARLSWTEPIGNPAKGNFLTAAYRFQYRWNNADKLTYDYPVEYIDYPNGEAIIGSDMIFSETLSNRFRNDYMSQDIRLGFKHVEKKVNMEAGLSLVPQRSKSIDLINSARNIPERWTWNFAPFLRYRWKPSKSKQLMLDYRGRSSQPTMTQLQPVADVSNPLAIVVGNPDLKPSFTHNIMLRFHNFNSEAQRSIMTMLHAQVMQNSIVSKTTYDSETGGRTTTYTNVNGQWNVRAMNMISFPFRNKKWTFNNHLMLYYSTSVGFNNGLRNRANSLMANESFGIAFRPDYLEFELRPTYGIQTVHNTVQSAGNQTVHTYGGNFYATYNSPFGLVLNSDLSYTATSGYSEGFDENRWLWNASIGYQFLQDRSLTLSLKAYDLLRQNSNISRTITANYIEDNSYNSLGRYFMVTLAWKFNTFGAGKQPASLTGDPDRPGPPPGAGRGPMGPPPGGGRPF